MVMLESFGDELFKLAEEPGVPDIPFPTVAETDAHRAAAKKYGALDKSKHTRVYRAPTRATNKQWLVSGPVSVGPTRTTRRSPRSRNFFRDEEKQNPWMRDEKKWVKYNNPSRGGSIAPEFESRGKAFKTWTAALDKREADAKARWKNNPRKRDHLSPVQRRAMNASRKGRASNKSSSAPKLDLAGDLRKHRMRQLTATPSRSTGGWLTDTVNRQRSIAAKAKAGGVKRKLPTAPADGWKSGR